MCGIAGFIGESKNNIVTYQIITKLFEKTEIRGVDAAGFWGTHAKSNKIIFHKEPIKSSKLVRKDVWKRLAKFNTNLLLCHARAASQGVGEPSNNHNNHPFTNSNRCIGLVHNGRVTDDEYQTLKTKYEVFSDCDSEILLRIFEGGEQYGRKAIDDFPGESFHSASRLSGLRDIFSFINYGHMAIAIGEWSPDGSRNLWLMRNAHRTLWAVDLREELGQIFFCSTQQIWKDAINACNGIESVIGKSQKLSEIPTEEIWNIRIDDKNPHKIQKFKVTKNDIKPWKNSDAKIEIAKNDYVCEIVTNLDVKDRITETKVDTLIAKHQYDTMELNRLCDKVRQKILFIETQSELMVNDQSIPQRNFEELLDQLDQSNKDLDGSIKLLGRY